MRQLFTALLLMCACSGESPTAPISRSPTANDSCSPELVRFEPTTVPVGASRTATLTFCGSTPNYLCPCYFYADDRNILEVSGFLGRNSSTADVTLTGKKEGSTRLEMILPNFVRPSGTLTVATIQVVAHERRRGVRH